MVALIRYGLLFLLLLTTVAQAEPEILDIGKFSERYYAKVTIGEGDHPSVIQVYDRKRPKEPIITVEAEGLYGGIEPNVHELPYGEYSLLIYEDFNFDGKKDLALMDGNKSCYNGPSFQVYLANDNGGFAHNSAYTRLAQEYCGFFATDAKTETISVMTKSGCCWHLFETYKVVRGNSLNLVYSLTDDAATSQNYSGQTIIEGSGKNKKTTIRYTLRDDARPPIFQFDLQSAPHKEVVLLPFGYYSVDYALLNHKNDKAIEVEYSYELAAQGVLPPSKKRHEHVLTFDAENKSVCFGIGDTTYTVIDQEKRLGVQVQQGKRITFLAGNPETRFGNLTEIREAKTNLKIGSCFLKAYTNGKRD